MSEIQNILSLYVHIHDYTLHAWKQWMKSFSTDWVSERNIYYVLVLCIRIPFE